MTGRLDADARRARHGWDVTAVNYPEVAIERGRTLAQAAGVEITWHVRAARHVLPPPSTTPD